MMTNVETNGRFHSDWMSMMYPRLFIARNLLKNNGIILVSINDVEFPNLRKIMDEIFGEENFIGTYIWKNKAGGGGKQNSNTPSNEIKKKEAFVLDHEYIVVYAKDIEEIFRFNEILSEEDLKSYSNPDNDPRGKYKLGSLEMMMPKPISTMYYEMTDPDGIKVKPKGGRLQWRYCKERTLKGLKEGSVVWVKIKSKDDKRGYRYVLKTKQYLMNGDEERTKISRSILYNLALSANGTKEIMEIFNQDKTEVSIFSNPKPIELLKYLISVVGVDNEIILDFFAGSGTTAHAMFELNYKEGINRKFILIQLPEKTDEKSEAFKHGYKTISEITKERIRRVIKNIEKGKKVESNCKIDLGFKVFKLQKSNYKIWEDYEGQDMKELNKQLQLFKTPLVNGYNDINVIYECIIKEGLSLNAKIEEIKLTSNKVFRVFDENQTFFICLDDKIKSDTLNKLNLKKDDLFVCIDNALDDSQKVNIAIQCKLKAL